MREIKIYICIYRAKKEGIARALVKFSPCRARPFYHLVPFYEVEAETGKERGGDGTGTEDGMKNSDGVRAICPTSGGTCVSRCRRDIYERAVALPRDVVRDPRGGRGCQLEIPIRMRPQNGPVERCAYTHRAYAYTDVRTTARGVVP